VSPSNAYAEVGGENVKRRWFVLCVLLVGILMATIRVYSAPSETEDELYEGLFLRAYRLDEKPLMFVPESEVTDVYVLDAINQTGQSIRVDNQTAFRPFHDLLRSHAYNVAFQRSYYHIGAMYLDAELEHKGTLIGPAPPPIG
jgi:hypothetical protein